MESMPSEDATGGGISQGEQKIIQAVDGIKNKVANVTAQVAAVSKAVMDVAVGTQGVDENMIKQKMQAAMVDNPGSMHDPSMQQKPSMDGMKPMEIMHKYATKEYHRHVGAAGWDSSKRPRGHPDGVFEER